MKRYVVRLNGLNNHLFNITEDEKWFVVMTIKGKIPEGSHMEFFRTRREARNYAKNMNRRIGVI